MRSKITIEIDFENNNSPYLNILHIPSDDVRDKLIKNLLERIGSEKDVVFKVDYSYPKQEVIVGEDPIKNVKLTPSEKS